MSDRGLQTALKVEQALSDARANNLMGSGSFFRFSDSSPCCTTAHAAVALGYNLESFMYALEDGATDDCGWCEIFGLRKEDAGEVYDLMSEVQNQSDNYHNYEYAAELIVNGIKEFSI